MGVGLAVADPDRRHARPRGPAPRGDEAARRAQLVPAELARVDPARAHDAPPEPEPEPVEERELVAVERRSRRRYRGARLMAGAALLLTSAPCASASSPEAATAPASTRSSAPSSARASTPTGTSSWASATAGPACSRARRWTSRSRRTRGILHRGGTILGSSRTNPYKDDGRRRRRCARRSQARNRRRADPDRRRGHARRRRAGSRDDGIDVVGVPKTIDNDLAGTDFTFGFQTAVQIATDAIDRLHTTAESHNRVMVVRGDGPPRRLDRRPLRAWPAAPTRSSSPSARSTSTRCARTCAAATHRAARSRSSSSPRAPRRRTGGRDPDHETKDAFGHVRLGGIAVQLEHEIEERTGLRDAHDDPRPRPARRHAGRLRPRARRRASASPPSMRRPRGDFGDDGRAARHRDRDACRSTRRSPSPSWSTRSSTRRPRCSSASALAVPIVLIGLNLRPLFASLPPLVHDVRADLGLSAAAAGLLTTGPLLCLGILAPLGPRIARRMPVERLLVACALATAVGCGARGLGGTLRAVRRHAAGRRGDRARPGRNTRAHTRARGRGRSHRRVQHVARERRDRRRVHRDPARAGAERLAGRARDLGLPALLAAAVWVPPRAAATMRCARRSRTRC